MQFLVFIVTLIVVWKFLVLVWYVCAWLVTVACLGMLHVVKFVRDVIRATVVVI